MTARENDQTATTSGVPAQNLPRGEELVATLMRMRGQQEAITEASHSDAFVAGDVDQLAREITEIASKALGVERANVWLFNEDETELRCIDLFEATPKRHSSGGVLSEAEYRSEFAALKKVRFVDADDPLTDPRTAGYVEGYIKPLRITSMLDAVIEVSGRRLGLLCLEHVGSPHHWERDEVAFACSSRTSSRCRWSTAPGATPRTPCGPRKHAIAASSNRRRTASSSSMRTARPSWT